MSILDNRNLVGRANFSESIQCTEAKNSLPDIVAVEGSKKRAIKTTAISSRALRLGYNTPHQNTTPSVIPPQQQNHHSPAIALNPQFNYPSHSNPAPTDLPKPKALSTSFPIQKQPAHAFQSHHTRPIPTPTAPQTLITLYLSSRSRF